MSFTRRMGGLPLFRHIDDDTATALDAVFEPVELVAGEPLPKELLEDVVLIDDAILILMTSVERLGERWTGVTQQRRGAVVAAKPLRPLLFVAKPGAPSPDTLPESTYEVTESGTVWRLRADDAKKLLAKKKARPKLRPAHFETMAFTPSGPAEVLRIIAALEWIDRAAESELLTPIQRIALARCAKAEVVETNHPLTKIQHIPDAVRLLGPGCVAIHSIPKAHDMVMFTGSMIGFSIWNLKAASSNTTIDTRGWVLSWRPDWLGQLTGRSPLAQGAWMSRFCRERQSILDDADEIAHALLETPILAQISEPRVRALLAGATTVVWRVGAPPPVPVGLEPGLCVIVAGEVVGSRIVPSEIGGAVARVRFDPVVVGRGQLPGDGPNGPRIIQVIGIGETSYWLDAVLNNGEDEDDVQPYEAPHFSARVPSQGVFIPAWRVGRALGPEISQDVHDHAQELAEHLSGRRELALLDGTSDLASDDLTVVWTTDVEGEALSSLHHEGDSRLLETLATHFAVPEARGGFDERSVLVKLVNGEPGDVKPVATGEGWTKVELATLPGHAVATLHGFLVSHPDVTYAFVWAAADLDIGHSVALAADLVLVMNHDVDCPRPRFGGEHAAFIYANLVRPSETAQLPPATVRLHALTDPNAPIEGFAGRQESVARWARAVSRRRIGVALGGGGAWGWAHFALLYEMERRGIPVDMIAGASFGAVAGAYYVLGGLPALWFGINHDRELQRAMFSSMIWGQPIAKYLDGLPAALEASIDVLKHFDPLPADDDAGFKAVIGQNGPSSFDKQTYLANLAMLSPRPVRLTHTPTPFFPVATDIVAGSESPVLHTTVGRGVRASGSLPPMFPLTREGDAAYADGGLSRNVPADVVQLEGAALIVGSNIVPPPFVRAPRPFQSEAGKVLARLNPARRVLSAVLGLQTLFNQAGAVDTGLAPVLFQSEWDGKLFFQIDKARDIITDTMATQKFWQALDGLDGRWRALRKARRR